MPVKQANVKPAAPHYFIRIVNYMHLDIYERLLACAQDQNMGMSDVIDRALRAYLPPVQDIPRNATGKRPTLREQMETK